MHKDLFQCPIYSLSLCFAHVPWPIVPLLSLPMSMYTNKAGRSPCSRLCSCSGSTHGSTFSLVKTKGSYVNEGSNDIKFGLTSPWV